MIFCWLFCWCAQFAKLLFIIVNSAITAQKNVVYKLNTCWAVDEDFKVITSTSAVVANVRGIVEHSRILPSSSTAMLLADTKKQTATFSILLYSKIYTTIRYSSSMSQTTQKMHAIVVMYSFFYRALTLLTSCSCIDISLLHACTGAVIAKHYYKQQTDVHALYCMHKQHSTKAISKTFFGVFIKQFISDIEQLLGTRVLIKIRTLKSSAADGRFISFKYDFCCKFGFYFESVDYSGERLFSALLFFGKSHDLNFLIDSIRNSLALVPFAKMQLAISNVNKTIDFMWYLWWNEYKAAGIYMTLSGKLSWHLLTISRTVFLRIGKTAASTVDLNALYQNRQFSSETGAYGITIRFYSRSVTLYRIRKVL